MDDERACIQRVQTHKMESNYFEMNISSEIHIADLKSFIIISFRFVSFRSNVALFIVYSII